MSELAGLRYHVLSMQSESTFFVFSRELQSSEKISYLFLFVSTQT